MATRKKSESVQVDDSKQQESSAPADESTLLPDDTLAEQPIDAEQLTSAEYDEQIHSLRVRRIADALQRLEPERLEFIASGQQNPGERLQDETANLFIELASDGYVNWPATSWTFLEIARKCAAILEQRFEGSLDWRSPVQPWPPKVWELLGQLHEQLDTLLAPPEPPRPRRVALEPLQQLLDDKVSHLQIAEIYEWKLPNGEPDLTAVREAIEGKRDVPTEKVFPPKLSGGPQRQPSMTAIDNLAELLKTELETQSPEPIFG